MTQQSKFGGRFARWARSILLVIGLAFIWSGCTRPVVFNYPTSFYKLFHAEQNFPISGVELWFFTSDSLGGDILESFYQKERHSEEIDGHERDILTTGFLDPGTGIDYNFDMLAPIELAPDDTTAMDVWWTIYDYDNSPVGYVFEVMSEDEEAYRWWEVDLYDRTYVLGFSEDGRETLVDYEGYFVLAWYKTRPGLLMSGHSAYVSRNVFVGDFISDPIVLMFISQSLQDFVKEMEPETTSP